MRYPSNILEEELKNKVAHDFFGKYDCTGIIEKIDFSVKAKGTGYLLWAEAKKNATDIVAMLAQLVLTIGKARTFNEILPPKFLGCFDCEKIAFVPYSDIQDIFHQNDFNWNVAPSNRETKEFKQIYSQINSIINNQDDHRTYRFDFEKDEKSLKLFILKNFMPGGEISKIKIDKNNFISVYAKWLEAVKPTIDINWGVAKKHQIIDGDFYLADLLSRENLSIKEKLNVLLKSDRYELDRKVDEMGLFSSKTTGFTDKQKAHSAFWAIYERPPREDYWDHIIERRDLLVPQDVRERKGSFFTPKIWVELSQKYIADVLGENWQEEYYVWDCAAGTGNLLAGLTNNRNIWASTLDKADVDVMHDRIKNGANLFEDNVFQFDFLNDDFDKLPKGLKDIIDDAEKRKKLIVYINPPYADASSNMKTSSKEGNSYTKIHNCYANNYLGAFARELFAQFLVRIYQEIPNCKIGIFSKLKLFTVNHAKTMQTWFKANLLKGFVVPSDTFDNVKGKFPISFQIWNTEEKIEIVDYAFDVYDKNTGYQKQKMVYNFNRYDKINDWIVKYKGSGNNIGYLARGRNDFQNKGLVFIVNSKKKATNSFVLINQDNLISISVYYAVQNIPEATWLNDRDQFLYPNDGWERDIEFQSDCLVYALFNNNISSKHGTNHWIPFTEEEVGNSRKSFDSHFMSDFIAGKIKAERGAGLFVPAEQAGCAAVGGAVKFSSVAKNIFNAGRELWKYYHTQPGCDVNAGLYDIREHFQDRNASGKMNNKSNDETYNELIGNLRSALKALANKIEPKVYEYRFLRG